MLSDHHLFAHILLSVFFGARLISSLVFSASFDLLNLRAVVGRPLSMNDFTECEVLSRHGEFLTRARSAVYMATGNDE